MKFAMIIASMLFVGSAFAGQVKFKCEMNSSITYKNQFALEGSVNDGDATFSNVGFDFSVRKAGNTSQVERLAVTRDGNIKYFEPGPFNSQKRSIAVTSAVKGDAVESIEIFVDFAGAFLSKVRLLDGTTYFSTCKSL